MESLDRLIHYDLVCLGVLQTGVACRAYVTPNSSQHLSLRLPSGPYIPFHSIPFRSIPFRSVSFYSIPSSLERKSNDNNNGKF